MNAESRFRRKRHAFFPVQRSRLKEELLTRNVENAGHGLFVIVVLVLSLRKKKEAGDVSRLWCVFF
jgi:hypothetical protein